MADRFEQYRPAYAANWASLQIRAIQDTHARREAQLLLNGKPRYQEVERRTSVPWWFTGLCHYRESDFDMATYLGNGQPLNRVTTIVPIGRGPFATFEDGAVDAYTIEGFLHAVDWSPARVAYRLKGFNGYGYHQFGVNSPYLYGGSTIYGPPEARGGKYVADHDFRQGVVDTQLGTLVILKKLIELDPSVQFSAGVDVPDPVGDKIEHGILWVQQSLNALGANPKLVEDGVNGPKTMGAVDAFQLRNGLSGTGLADAATVAKIETQLAALPPAPPSVPRPGPAQRTLADDIRDLFRSIFG